VPYCIRLSEWVDFLCTIQLRSYLPNTDANLSKIIVKLPLVAELRIGAMIFACRCSLSCLPFLVNLSTTAMKLPIVVLKLSKVVIKLPIIAVKLPTAIVKLSTNVVKLPTCVITYAKLPTITVKLPSAIEKLTTTVMKLPCSA
jgi:hypothetical protein